MIPDYCEKDYFVLYENLGIKLGNMYQVIKTKDKHGQSIILDFFELQTNSHYKLVELFRENDVFTIIDLRCYWHPIHIDCYSDIQILFKGKKYNIIMDIEEFKDLYGKPFSKL